MPLLMSILFKRLPLCKFSATIKDRCLEFLVKFPMINKHITKFPLNVVCFNFVMLAFYCRMRTLTNELIECNKTLSDLQFDYK